MFISPTQARVFTIYPDAFIITKNHPFGWLMVLFFLTFFAAARHNNLLLHYYLPGIIVARPDVYLVLVVFIVDYIVAGKLPLRP